MESRRIENLISQVSVRSLFYKFVGAICKNTARPSRVNITTYSVHEEFGSWQVVLCDWLCCEYLDPPYNSSNILSYTSI